MRTVPRRRRREDGLARVGGGDSRKKASGHKKMWSCTELVFSTTHGARKKKNRYSKRIYFLLAKSRYI